MKVEVILLKEEVFDFAVSKREVGVLFELIGDDIGREMERGNSVGTVSIGGVDVVRWMLTETHN